jgi:hypothetical protein
MKTQITQQLQDYQFTFSEYLELSPEGCEHEAGALQDFYDENVDDFSIAERDLYDVVLGLSQEAMYYHEAELRQCRSDELADEMSYEGARHFY